MLRATDERWEHIRDHFQEERIPAERATRRPNCSHGILDALLGHCALPSGTRFRDATHTIRRCIAFLGSDASTKSCVMNSQSCRTRCANGECSKSEDIHRRHVCVRRARWGTERTNKTWKSAKTMAVVDRNGKTLAVSTHAARHHNVKSVRLCVYYCIIGATPHTLIGEHAYGTVTLHEQLRQRCPVMTAPQRFNRSSRPTQDTRWVRQYPRRSTAVRFFAWMRRNRPFIDSMGTSPSQSSVYRTSHGDLVVIKRF